VVSLEGDEGQGLVVAVFVLAIAAVSIVGLEAAQARIFAGARSQRAGEAAAEAALASVADAYVAYLSSLRARAGTSPRPSPDIVGLVADRRVVADASAAAEALARANGGARIASLALSCAGGRVEAWVTVDERPHHAGFSAPECSRR
jgi:hypothetical protein